MLKLTILFIITIVCIALIHSGFDIILGFPTGFV